MARQAFLPGSTILLAMASASMTGTPSSLNMLDTVLFPVPTPPVSPTKYITVSLHWCPAGILSTFRTNLSAMV